MASNVSQYMPWYSENAVESIILRLHPNFTINRAIKVDAIFIYDDRSSVALSSLDPNRWFQQRNALIANLADGLDVIKWELVPGAAYHIAQLPERHRDAIAVYIFANNPNNKVDISNIKDVLIELTSDSLQAMSAHNH